MEVDDDLFVVIIGDEGEKPAPEVSLRRSKRGKPFEVIDENAESSENIAELMESVEKHGQMIKLENIKEEPQNYEYLDCDSLDDEYVPDWNEVNSEDDIFIYDEDKNVFTRTKKQKKKRYKMLNVLNQKSFVNDLREDYPELKEDRQLLIQTLCNIMRTIKAPPPPRDYFRVNDVNFECIKCEALSESMPAASRHWQEKHGQRYLVCFACGVDFRSTTNLYKHEKRCNAPDAVIVLKARALTLGRKGRGRPFIPKPEDLQRIVKPGKDKKRFQCWMCPAHFSSKVALDSHVHAHVGSRPFGCSQCPAAYTSKAGLKKHFVKHTDVQFICDHCGRSFKTKTALVAHLDTHRALRRFPCALCGKRFAQRSAMQLHADRKHHRLPPPCACQICPKRYPRMSLLKNHMQRAHGMNLITRKMFYKSLPMLSEIQIQQAKVVLKSEIPQDSYHIFHDEPENAQNEDQEAKPDTFNEFVADDIIAPDLETVVEIKTEVETETEQLADESDLSEEAIQYIRKLQQGEIDSSTKFVIIENGKITYVDESNIDAYREHISEVEAALENNDTVFENRESEHKKVISGNVKIKNTKSKEAKLK